MYRAHDNVFLHVSNVWDYSYSVSKRLSPGRARTRKLLEETGVENDASWAWTRSVLSSTSTRTEDRDGEQKEKKRHTYVQSVTITPYKTL